MAINERLIDTKVEAAPPVGNEAEQGLILHLDANDVDSFDGDGTVWYDISEHDVTIPLSDNADDLELHLNASDSTSYDPATDTTTWTDISGNSNDATLTSLTNTDYDIDNGGFFTLDGASDFASNTSVSLGTDSGSYSTEMWFNADTIATNDILFQLNGVGTSRRHLLYFNSTSTVRALSYRASDLNNSAAATSGTISTGTWYHVVAVFKDDTYLKLYVNGVEVATTSSNVTDARPTSYDEYYIGKEDDFGQKFDGKIGAVRYYSKALSASEVGQNYRHGRDTVYTDLIPDTDLELHLDADSFPQKNEAGYSNTPSTWTALTGSNGTISGATFDSELGNWLDFDGVDDKVNITASSPVTLEIWVKPDATSGIDALAGHESITSNYIYWNSLDLTVNGVIFTSLDKVTDWTHIALVESGSNLLCYKNGNLIQTLAGALGTYNLLGARTAGTNQYLDGKIGQVRMYSSALTQDQIRQNYNFTKPSYPNGNNGTITGATWNPSGYFVFDGFNDYVLISSTANSPVDFSKNNYTISGWINPDAVNIIQPIFTKYGTADSLRSIYFSIETDGTLRFFQRANGTSDIVYSSSTISASTWTHVALVRDSSTVKFYINGDLDVSRSSTFTPNAGGTQAINVGSQANGNYSFFDGKISKVRLYDKALTQAEITALHSEGQ